jgi:hypothetical protein
VFISAGISFLINAAPATRSEYYTQDDKLLVQHDKCFNSLELNYAKESIGESGRKNRRGFFG